MTCYVPLLVYVVDVQTQLSVDFLALALHK